MYHFFRLSSSQALSICDIPSWSWQYSWWWIPSEWEILSVKIDDCCSWRCYSTKAEWIRSCWTWWFGFKQWIRIFLTHDDVTDRILIKFDNPAELVSSLDRIHSTFCTIWLLKGEKILFLTKRILLSRRFIFRNKETRARNNKICWSFLEQSSVYIWCLKNKVAVERNERNINFIILFDRYSQIVLCISYKKLTKQNRNLSYS